MCALANFFNTLQSGAGAAPDFTSRRIFTPKDLHPFSSQARLTSNAVGLDDADSELVAQVPSGDTDVFEQVVRRHRRRVFGTLAAIVGQHEGRSGCNTGCVLEGLRTYQQ